MSDDLYPIRVRWDGRKGIAKHAGVVVTLTAAPLQWVPSLQGLTEIDYAPTVRVAQVRIAADAMRMLDQTEIDVIELTLVQMAQDAQDALEGQSTLAVMFDRRADGG